MTATEVILMTTEELEALPDEQDGIDRWLIRGQLREKPMTKRNRFHAHAEARVAQLLQNWVDQQPRPRGQVFSGEVGCRLTRDPDSTCGIDVAYFSADTVAAQTKTSSLMVGPPVVAVEILSPNDKQEEIDEKVSEYLAAGVAHVWVVSPRFQTVTVFRPDTPPVLRNVTDDLTAEPELPGFRVPVARVFEDWFPLLGSGPPPMPRPAAPADTPALVALAAATGVFKPHELDALQEVLDDYHDANHDYGHRTWVIDGDDTGPVGFAYFAPTAMTDRTWELWWIAVAPTRQRGGRGGDLLRFVEAEVVAAGARLLLIETSSTPAYHPTREFYLKHAYAQVAVIPDFYADDDGKVIFSKRIG